MVGTSPRVNRYTGRWYTNEEAQKIETDLQLNSGTGDSWYWKDRDGNIIQFSGSTAHKEPIKEKKIPLYGKKREHYFKNKFKY